jgi:UDP-N-acetylglucosamine acyltransferase
MIHETSIVDSAAKIGEGVSIGPFSIIGPDVIIEMGTSIASHVVIDGKTTIGSGNRIYDFACIGCEPQHVGYRGEKTGLSIGENNTIREYCTISRGTAEGGGMTRIGDNNFLMAYVHVAHDCSVGSHTIFANNASLAGHVSLGDYVVLGGFSLIHQYCRVGAHSMTQMGTVCPQDIPPYILAAGNKVEARGINVKGLRNRDFSEDDIVDLKRAYKLIYRSKQSTGEAISMLESGEWKSEHIPELAHFLKSSDRGIIS